MHYYMILAYIYSLHTQYVVTATKLLIGDQCECWSVEERRLSHTIVTLSLRRRHQPYKVDPPNMHHMKKVKINMCVCDV